VKLFAKPFTSIAGSRLWAFGSRLRARSPKSEV
jgi:hypothetical protein